MTKTKIDISYGLNSYRSLSFIDDERDLFDKLCFHKRFRPAQIQRGNQMENQYMKYLAMIVKTTGIVLQLGIEVTTELFQL